MAAPFFRDPSGAAVAINRSPAETRQNVYLRWSRTATRQYSFAMSSICALFARIRLLFIRGAAPYASRKRRLML